MPDYPNAQIESIISWHDRLFAYLNDYRKNNDPTLTYRLRTRDSNRSGTVRLENGYWFLGNEQYIWIGFYQPLNGARAVPTVGIRVWLGDDHNKPATIFEINYSEKEESKTYDQLVNFIEEKKEKGYFYERAEKRYSHEYQGQNPLEAIETFITRDKSLIDEFLVEKGLIDDFQIHSEVFEKNLRRSERIREAIKARPKGKKYITKKEAGTRYFFCDSILLTGEQPDLRTVRPGTELFSDGIDGLGINRNASQEYLNKGDQIFYLSHSDNYRNQKIAIHLSVSKLAIENQQHLTLKVEANYAHHRDVIRSYVTTIIGITFGLNALCLPLTPEEFNDLIRVADSGEFSGENTSESNEEDLKGKFTTASTDALASADSLGRVPLVGSLVKLLSSADQKGPLTIGLFGDWGSGKSTFIQLLKKELPLYVAKCGRSVHNDVSFDFCYFNAWKHEHIEHIHAGLAEQLISYFVQESKQKWFKRKIGFWLYFNGKKYPLTILSVPFILIIVSFSFLDKDAIQAVINCIPESLDKDKANAAGQLLLVPLIINLVLKLFSHPMTTRVFSYLKLPTFKKHLGLVPQISKDLGLVFDFFLGKHKGSEDKPNPGKKRLLFVIDDLDRCGYQNIMKIFQAVRLILDRESIYVLIAIDGRIALNAVAKYYQVKEGVGVEQAQKLAVEYMDKIFQLALHLIPPKDQVWQDHIEQNLFQLNEKEKQELTGLSMQRDDILPESIGENLVDVHSQDGSELDDLDFIREDESTQRNEEKDVTVQTLLQDKAVEARFFALCSKELGITNPRKVKRMRNSFRLLKLNYQQEIPPLSLILLLFMYELGLQKGFKFARDTQEDNIIVIPETSQSKADAKKVLALFIHAEALNNGSLPPLESLVEQELHRLKLYCMPLPEWQKSTLPNV